MTTVRVGILGATGYSGAEAVRYLLQHSSVRITAVTAEQHVGQRLPAVHPFLRGCDLELESVDVSGLPDRCDAVIAGLPEDVSSTVLPALVGAGVRVIDLSAAFRIKADALHLRWYKTDPAPELRRAAVYGIPELYRDRVREARMIANPGCYPTGVILAVTPLLRAGVVAGPVIVDSKSGVTGARRKAAIEQLFAEVTESVRAYGVTEHRHGPEMEQELEAVSGRPIPVVFTPHVVPMSRGILSTIYVPLAPDVDAALIEKLLCQAYGREPFVVLAPGRWPETRETRGSNLCAIGWTVEKRTRTAILVTSLDNLGKGAAGQAVQNLNVMFGLPETTGLLGPAWGP